MISSFEVHGDGTVEWETASEVGTAGFNLLRQDPASGSFVRINDGLLPALIGSPQGGVYRYPDRDVAPGGNLYLPTGRGGSRRNHPQLWSIHRHRRRGQADRPRRRTRPNPSPPPKRLRTRTATNASAHAPTGRTVSPLAARPLAAAAPQASAPKTAARILVEQDGLYVVSADQIAAALAVTFQEAQDWIKRGKIRLQQGGKPVAWRADPSGERLYFYGQAVQGVDSIYTRYNVYWLDKANGLAMNVLTGTGPAPAASAQPFQSSIHVEENRKPAPFLATDPDADFWYWNYVAGVAHAAVLSGRAAVRGAHARRGRHGNRDAPRLPARGDRSGHRQRPSRPHAS